MCIGLVKHKGDVQAALFLAIKMATILPKIPKKYYENILKVVNKGPFTPSMITIKITIKITIYASIYNYVCDVNSVIL